MHKAALLICKTETPQGVLKHYASLMLSSKHSNTWSVVHMDHGGGLIYYYTQGFQHPKLMHDMALNS
jgi:hypothetical protein